MTFSLLPPPSSRLPPVRQIRECPVETLQTLLHYLRGIYNPSVRGTRRIDHRKRDNVYGDTQQDQWRGDEFERAYTIRWLTGLVAQASFLQEASADDGANGVGLEEKVEALVRDAASLLAICAGTAAAGTLTRRFSFGSPLLDSMLEVQLTDIPISVDDNAATVGALTWGSACLMAEMVVEDPETFGLLQGQDVSSHAIRVLELGAGTGLVSLAFAKLLSAKCGQVNREAKTPTVVATDYHPAVLANLDHNINANFPEGAGASVALSAHVLDWSTFSDETGGAPTLEPPFDVPFDLILGADIIYEPTHARWIRNCVSKLLRRPGSPGDSLNSGAPARFHLLIPLRPTHALESRTVEEVFPKAPRDTMKGHRGDYGGAQGLYILDKETILCEAEDSRPGAEVEYVHYQIGWAS